jgi:hypothetical protein
MNGLVTQYLSVSIAANDSFIYLLSNFVSVLILASFTLSFQLIISDALVELKFEMLLRYT